MLARGLDPRDHLAPLDARELVQLGGHPVEGRLRQLDRLGRAARPGAMRCVARSRRRSTLVGIGGARRARRPRGGLGARRVVPVPAPRDARPRRRRARTSTTRRSGSGARGSSGTTAPVIPCAWRSPVGRRWFAQGSASAPGGRPGGAIRPSPKASNSASRYSSGAPVSAHQIRIPRRSSPRRRCSHWPSAVGLAVARHVGLQRGDAPADRAIRSTREEDGRVRPPEGREPSRERLRGRVRAVEAERRAAAPATSRRGSAPAARWQRRAELDDVDAGLPARDGGAPANGSVGQEPDGAQQVGCASSRFTHRADGTTGVRDRYGRAMRTRARGRTLAGPLSALRGKSMAEVEIFTPTGVLAGLTAGVPLSTNGPDLTAALNVREARWFPLVRRAAPSRSARPRSPRTTSSSSSPPQPAVQVHMTWYSVTLDLGPYRVTGELATHPGFVPEQSLARPGSTFVAAPRRAHRAHRRGRRRRRRPGLRPRQSLRRRAGRLEPDARPLLPGRRPAHAGNGRRRLGRSLRGSARTASSRIRRRRGRVVAPADRSSDALDAALTARQPGPARSPLRPRDPAQHSSARRHAERAAVDSAADRGACQAITCFAADFASW